MEWSRAPGPPRKIRAGARLAVKVDRRGAGATVPADSPTPGSAGFAMQTPTMGASEPMFNLPRVVVLLAGVMVAMQLIQMLLPSEESLQFLLALAFIPARYSGAAAELPL